MIRVTANEYLDRRKLEWVEAELNGHVRFDYNRATLLGSRLVEINDSCPAIQRACGGAL